MRAVSMPHPGADSWPVRAFLGRDGHAKKHPPRLCRLRFCRPSFLGVQQQRSRILAKIKAHSLTGRITPAVMLDAFRNVKRNRGAAGIDKVSITLFENNLD